MNQSGTNQFTHRPQRSVRWVAPLGIGVQHQDQLVHRETDRVFFEEQR